MSSNPFRRQPPRERPLDTPPAAPGRAFEDAVNHALEDKGRKPSATKKVVRIQTPPPLSPDPVTTTFDNPLIRRISNEPRAGSPPPDIPVDAPPSASALELDPLSSSFGAEIAPLDPQVIINTRRNSDGGTSPPTALAAKVLNPFQRTLATIDPQDAGDGSATGGAEEQKGNALGGETAPIDVDSFTKMLKTGQGGPTPVERNNLPKPETGADRAKTAGPSNTIPHNFDDLEDASSEEESTLVPQRTQSAKGAPPPPKHKHGKSISDRAPQTVSFNDFEDDFGASRKPQQPSEETPRKASDSEQGKKRLPPPPPLSRRPPSATFESAQPTSPTVPPNAGSKASKAPPPPPARRGANRNSFQPDPAAAVPDFGDAADETFDAAAARRSLNAGHEPSSRSSSVSEYRKNSAAVPPPPPPTRRRRGSSKSSMENQPAGSLRSTAEARKAGDDTRRSSQESARRAAALGQVEEDGDVHETGKPPRDILADLSAFQAEVDALRSSHRQT